ncbi:putative CheW-like domain-containing protein [Gammaproteobacteria bacterium]
MDGVSPMIPMISMISGPASPLRDTLGFWSAGRQGVLPVASVINISVASAAMPVPFASPFFEGIVVQDGLLTPQIDWTAYWGGAARSGGYRMRVRTSRGPVWFRVDRVLPPGSGGVGSDAPAEMLTEMETLIAPLAVATDDPNPPSLAACAWDHEIALLMVESQGQTLALPAAAVLRVEQPAEVWPTRAGAPGERQVVLAEGLLAGVSLEHWLGQPVSVTTERAWALVVAGGEGRMAILVTAVQGLVAASPQRIRRMARGSRESFWYLDAQRGAIEVLDPAAVTGCSSAGPTLSERLKPARPPPSLGSRNPAERRCGLGAKRGLAVRAGSFHCLFPSTPIVQVIREVQNHSILTRRRAGCYPVIDLAQLLGGKPSAARRALLVKRRGPLPLALLVEEVALAEPDLTWRPFPAVPAEVQDFFAAIAIAQNTAQNGERSWLLLREGLFQGKVSPATKARIRASIRGWIEAIPPAVPS